MPGKVQAGPTNKNVATIDLMTATGGWDANGNPVNPVDGISLRNDTDYSANMILRGFKSENIYLGSVKLGDQVATKYTGYVYSINNGEYNLDGDDKIKLSKVNEIKIAIVPVDMEEWKAVTSAQVFLGDCASNGTGYDAATVEISGGTVFVTVKTTPLDAWVNPDAIMSLKTNLQINGAFPTELKSFNYVPFNHGVLTWKYTTDGGTTYSYPTYALLNSTDNANSWYEVETIISAAAGYSFINPAYNKATSELLYAATLTGDPDHREFKLTDISKDGKTAKLTIKKIKLPNENELNHSAVTSIELTSEMNFATNEVLSAREAAAKMPKSFYATINGERKQVEIANLASERCHWVIYSASGDEWVKMTDSQTFVQTDWQEVAASGNDYIHAYKARLEWDVDANGKPVWDYYNIGNKDDGTPKPMKAVLYALYYESSNDDLRVVDAYELDHVNGWEITFTVNAPRTYNGVKTSDPVEALRTTEAPAINFYGYGEDYTAYVYGQGTPVAKYRTGAVAWADFTNGTTMSCPKAGTYYKAVIGRQIGFTTASPEVYTYFNPTNNNVKEMKQGAVSITVQEPKAYAPVERQVRGAAASMDLTNGLNLNPAEIELYWSPAEYVYSANYGYEMFLDDLEYMAVVAIKVNPGYTLAFTPEVRFNGKVADAVEIQEAGGITYLLAGYTFKTGPAYDIEKDYVEKMLNSDIARPFAGGTVQKTIKPSESAARYYEFVDVTWYENGVEFEGTTFAKDKRYTAVVTWDCSKFSIKEDCTDKDLLVKDFAGKGYVKNAKITKSKSELTVTYEFPVTEYPALASVNDINIEAPNGLTVAEFYQFVASQLVATLNFEGGTTGVKALDGMVFNRGTNLVYAELAAASTNEEHAAVVKEALDAAYPGILAYNPYNKAAQNFELTGYIDARNYNSSAKKRVNINIHVAGTKSVITFNANGGVYAGSTILAENGMAYGFKYVPAHIYREGYFFAGWFTEANGGTRVKSATKFDGKTTTLYAHWVKVFTGKVWTLKAASYNAGRLTATATAPKTQVNGYEFSISKDGVNWTVNSQTKNVRYYVGLVSGTYFVKVRAYRVDSAGKLVYGAYSTTQKVVVK